jgi:hypothetical protein
MTRVGEQPAKIHLSLEFTKSLASAADSFLGEKRLITSPLVRFTAYGGFSLGSKMLVFVESPFDLILPSATSAAGFVRWLYLGRAPERTAFALFAE